ncbi:MAG: sn-glycerol-3-phosphate ABC transporter ATP-binding protein UgpC [Desulfobacterales bacterium]|nr:MAG: sn-glycerol-3-phosphate ABC transporter ATP-binding protein UgpC [Desulfobacterales bacterium]
MLDIVLKNLKKKFDNGFVAVHNINLEIAEKEFLVLVGPSGCGKSTTLRMIAGLEKITEGEIYIKNRLVNHLMPKDRNIAMVFQNYALYPHMKVYDNIAFGLKMRKIPKPEIDKLVHEASEILGIEDLLHRRPRQLSGGERQRVALGRAIVRKPDVFLFDEPLSNLDAKLRVQMREEIKKLHERLQTTIVYVTHDQVEAMTMGTRIVVMKNGVVQQVGKPLELYEKPLNLFVAGFLGSPAMNFLNARVVEERGAFFVKDDHFSLTIPRALKNRYSELKEKEVIFGIRPEHIFDKTLTDPFPNGESLKAKIEIVEPMGSVVVLVARCGTSKIIASVDSKTKARPHVEMDFLLDMSQMHLFDKEFEEAY